MKLFFHNSTASSCQTLATAPYESPDPAAATVPLMMVLVACCQENITHALAPMAECALQISGNFLVKTYNFITSRLTPAKAVSVDNTSVQLVLSGGRILSPQGMPQEQANCPTPEGSYRKTCQNVEVHPHQSSDKRIENYLCTVEADCSSIDGNKKSSIVFFNPGESSPEDQSTHGENCNGAIVPRDPEEDGQCKDNKVAREEAQQFSPHFHLAKNKHG